MVDEGPASGGAGPVGLWGVIAGLRGAAENVVRTVGSVNPLGELPALPQFATHPGALSAAQLTALRATLKAQRDGIAALQSQLTAFDQQLQVLEQLLGPVAEWSATWARWEAGVIPPPSPSGAARSAPSETAPSTPSETAPSTPPPPAES